MSSTLGYSACYNDLQFAEPASDSDEPNVVITDRSIVGEVT